jgi:hypothetical protein
MCNNYIVNSKNHGIFCTNDGDWPTISNNTVKDGNAKAIAGEQNTTNQCRHANLSNNLAESPTNSGIQNFIESTITGNIVRNSGGTSISQVSGTVTGNWVLNAGGNGITTWDIDESATVFTGNWIKGASSNGFFIDNTSNDLIVGNFVSGSGSSNINDTGTNTLTANNQLI